MVARVTAGLAEVLSDRVYTVEAWEVIGTLGVLDSAITRIRVSFLFLVPCGRLRRLSSSIKGTI